MGDTIEDRPDPDAPAPEPTDEAEPTAEAEPAQPAQPAESEPANPTQPAAEAEPAERTEPTGPTAEGAVTDDGVTGIDATRPGLGGRHRLPLAIGAVVAVVVALVGLRLVGGGSDQADGAVVPAGVASQVTGTARVEAEPGLDPAEVEAARVAVEAAFATVYSGPPDIGPKLDVVHESDDLDGVMGKLVESSAGAAGLLGVTVTDLAFDAPDRARVTYEVRFGGVLVATQKGEAVRVDGDWKLTRATVCQDLAMAANPCP